MASARYEHDISLRPIADKRGFVKIVEYPREGDEKMVKFIQEGKLNMIWIPVVDRSMFERAQEMVR